MVLKDLWLVVNPARAQPSGPIGENMGDQVNERPLVSCLVTPLHSGLTHSPDGPYGLKRTTSGGGRDPVYCRSLNQCAKKWIRFSLHHHRPSLR